MSSKLGEILVRENLITAQQLREALEYQRGNRIQLTWFDKVGFMNPTFKQKSSNKKSSIKVDL